MRPHLLPLLCLLFAFGQSVIPVAPLAAQSVPDDSLLHAFKRINAEVLTNGRAYQTLKEATEKNGHRLTGTAHGKTAEEAAFALLSQYGYKPEYLPFELRNWERDSLSLEIVPFNSDNFVPVKAVSLAHSPLKADLTAGIIDLGNGTPADFERLKLTVRKKVALINLSCEECTPEQNGANLHRSEKTALAIKYGAIGAIFVNHTGKILLTGTASVTGDLIPIPALCISADAGKQVRAWMKDEKLMAAIKMRNKSQLTGARNVTAEWPGTDLKKEKILIGGHLDCWDLGTGALDNGIGSYSVLEIARIFKALNLKTKRSIEFINFMGEEQGLQGSKAMVEKLGKSKRKMGRVKYMLNLDMACDPSGFGTGGRKEAAPFFTHVAGLIHKTDTAFKGVISDDAGLHSDHQPFMLAGVPTAAPNSNFRPGMLDCYHADCDVFSAIPKDAINNTVRYTAMLLYALANADTLPAKQLSPAETRDFLIAHNLKEKLVLGKEWKFEE